MWTPRANVAGTMYAGYRERFICQPQVFDGTAYPIWCIGGKQCTPPLIER